MRTPPWGRYLRPWHPNCLKNLAARLWALFEELLEVVVHSIAEPGAVDLPRFKRSPEYATLKALFADSFLGHQ
jgi:hypothetical protein